MTDRIDEIEQNLQNPWAYVYEVREGVDEDEARDAIKDLLARVRELEATLQAVEGEVAKVYCDLTGGRISKVNTLASVVIGEAEAYNERTCVADAWDEGYEAGDEYGYSSACAARYGDSPDEATPTNPYRPSTDSEQTND